LATHSRLGSTIGLALLFSILLAHSAAAESLPNPAASTAAQDYDQVIAYMPQAQAEIASVALARLIIALHDAKTSTARRLCDSTWTPSGTAVQKLGPSLAEHPANQKVWFYHSLRHAFPLACGQVSRVQFFLEMSRHLPAWVFLRPAGQEITFSQGSAVGSAAQTQFASR
jgi:hypothetical protein